MHKQVLHATCADTITNALHLSCTVIMRTPKRDKAAFLSLYIGYMNYHCIIE